MLKDEIEKQINFKKEPKKNWCQLGLIFQICDPCQEVEIISRKANLKKKHEAKFSINQMSRDEIEQLNQFKKDPKQAIKRMRIKFDIKIKWNKNTRDGIEKKIQLRKWSRSKLITIKKMMTKFDIKIKWNKMLRDKIEKKSIKKRIKNNNKKNEDQIW